MSPYSGGVMTHVKNLVARFVRKEEAATMVEYALMLSLIAVVCIIAVTLIGTNANTIFNNIATNLPA
jgi:pilus assembly protein Flp/PilA